MARPKGSKNKPKVIETTASVGHNSELTDEQRQVLTFQHKKAYLDALSKKKEADAALKNVCKKAKAELGAEAVDDIKLAIELESDEGVARLKADMERRARVAAWFGLEVGTQGALFAPDRTPVEDRAHAEGKRAGMEGNVRSAPQHYPQEIGDRWYAGYDAGQSVLRDQMKDRFTPRPADEEDDHQNPFEQGLSEDEDEMA